MKLLIAVASSRDVKPHFAMSLAYCHNTTFANGHLIGLTALHLYGGAAQSNLSRARQKILNMAINGNYTHVAMFDDDQQFPPDTVLRLAKHRKGFVFPNIAQKTPSGVNGVCLTPKPETRIDSTGKTGLERVAYGTLACTLIEIEAIRHVPAPHFEVLWDESLKDYQGEDHYFFRKLGQHGVEFYCDHDLSQSVKHIGDYPYGFGEASFTAS